MRVDVWSDVVCPWCFIGLANLDMAIEQFDAERGDAAADDPVEVVLHSFQLDPAAPQRDDLPLEQHLAQKYGTTVDQIRTQQERIRQLGDDRGIDFRFDRAIRGNTQDAHRLLHLARIRGLQRELKARLGRAYFTDGEPIGEAETLRRAALAVGLDADEIEAVLTGDAFAEEVAQDLEAAGNLGIAGVPFFVIDGRLGVSGAQPPEALQELLEQAASPQQEADVQPT